MGLAWLLILSQALVVYADADGTDTTLYPSPNERFGFGVVTDIGNFDVGRLHAGWYVNWGATSQIRNPAGLEYVQIIRLCDSQYRPCSTPYTPYGEALVQAVRNNPGLLWLIGNEPDRIRVQDSVHPTVYAQLYHELYYLIKGLDPTARIAIGGMVQATPLRMQWLEMVWNEYQRLYGETMPVDVWNVHAFVLRELRPGLPLPRLLACAPPGATELGAWGAEIPPGIDADCGLWIEIDDLDRMDLFQENIVRFRQWMRDHGQQDKELIISEYGILFPEELGYHYARVRSYMYATFDYFLNARDSQLGMPADGYRLVQRWAWYSLDDDSFSWGRTWGALFDPDTRQITPMGEAFAAYTSRLVRPYVDLKPVSITYTVRAAPLWAIEPVELTLQGRVMNRGNTPAGAFRVRFRRGAAGTGQLIGESEVPGLPSRYQGDAYPTIPWTTTQAQGATITLEVDPLQQVEESNEDNNALSITIDLPLDLAVTPPQTTRPAPITSAEDPIDIPLRAQIHNLGGRGAEGPLQVEFWHGDPQSGGSLIEAVSLQPGAGNTVEIIWRDRRPGFYPVFVRLVNVAGDINPANNVASGMVFVGTQRLYFPLAAVR